MHAMQMPRQSVLLSGTQHRSTGLFGQTAKYRATHAGSLQHVVRSQAAAGAGAGNTVRGRNYESASFRQDTGRQDTGRQDTGSSASTSAVVTDETQKEDRMEEFMSFLRDELTTMFTTGVRPSCFLR